MVPWESDIAFRGVFADLKRSLSGFLGTGLSQSSVLRGKSIVIDPGHGGTGDPFSDHYDSFRTGPNGEREEWVNLRVSEILADGLERAGAKVRLTRNEDKFVSIAERVNFILSEPAEVCVSVHHNSAGDVDTQLNYPAVFFHGAYSEDEKSALLAKKLLGAFVRQRRQQGLALSDQWIFNDGLGLLRGLNGHVPCVVGEYSFFNNAEEESLLRSHMYCWREAQCYFAALCEYFIDSQSLQKIGSQPLAPAPMEMVDLFKQAATEAYSQRHWEDELERGLQQKELGMNQEALQSLLISGHKFYKSPRLLDLLDGLEHIYRESGDVEKSEFCRYLKQQSLWVIKSGSAKE